MFQRKRACDLQVGDVIRCDAFCEAVLDEDVEYGPPLICVGGTFPPSAKLKVSIDFSRKSALYIVEFITGGKDQDGDWRWVDARRLGPGASYDLKGETLRFAALIDRYHVQLLKVDYFGRMNRDRTVIVYEIPSGK